MSTPCVWTEPEDYGGGPWETTCGRLFSFTDDGPNENGFKFCCWCGRSLEARPWLPDEEGES